MNQRIATATDLPSLEKLVNGAYRGESSKKGWTTEADLLGGVRTSEASLKKMINTPAAVILLAEEKGELQGCVYLEKQDDALYLGMLTVRPDLQGKGIGAVLMKASEDRATSLGCKRLKMTVITARHELIAYYGRKGFADTGHREAFPTDPAFGIPKQPLEFMVLEKVVNGEPAGR